MKQLRSLILLAVIILIVSCKSFQIYEKGYLTLDKRRVIYKLNPPTGFEKKLISEAHGKSYEFTYPDSGLFYFSTEDFGWNYNEIAATGNYILGGSRVEIISNIGTNEKGYWIKEAVKNIYWIGYKNIPQNRKAAFDDIINDFIARYNAANFIGYDFM